jgi:hypothetical protein
MDNQARAHRVIEAIWNRGELAVADELFDPDYVNHDGLIPDLVHGPEAIKVSVALYRIAFPHLHITVDEMSMDGETVVIHWTARRDTPGPAHNAGSADQALLTGMTRTRFSGGRIAESWTQWGGAQVLGDTGVTPAQ